MGTNKPELVGVGSFVVYGGRLHRVCSVKLGGIAGPHVTLECLHRDNDRGPEDGGMGHAWTAVELLRPATAADMTDPRD